MAAACNSEWGTVSKLLQNDKAKTNFINKFDNRSLLHIYACSNDNTWQIEIVEATKDMLNYQ
jgi:hypothetical protein